MRETCSSVDLGREEAQELVNLAAALSIFMGNKLQVFTEALIELDEVLLVFGDLGKQAPALLRMFVRMILDGLVFVEMFPRYRGEDLQSRRYP